MFDLKIINSVLDQLEEERGIPRERVIDAIETALATAYKKEYGKRGQIVRSTFDLNTGATEFNQIKIVVDREQVKMPEEEEEEFDENGEPIDTGDLVDQEDDEDTRIRFNPEQHILIEDAQRIKKDAVVDDELIFPLEEKSDFGRIAAQTAKQVIIQKIREAEKTSILGEYEGREGEIVSGTVQRIERGNVFLDLGRAPAILPYDEQIQGERFRQGERIRAYLYSVEEGARGVFLRVSRSHPKFLQKLFEFETPELTNGTVEIKSIAREPGSRSKIAVHATDDHIDPVGSLVGQRGVRVSTVMSELGGEKIDVIEWSEDPRQFIEDALSPAKVIDVDMDEEAHRANVEVTEDQQSLAIGKGGQNVRLAAKLTGWKIDIQSSGSGEELAETDGEAVDVTDDNPIDDNAEEAGREAAQSDEIADAATEAPDTPEETDEKFDESVETLEETGDETSEEEKSDEKKDK